MPKLSIFALPDTFAVPVMLAPVPVTTIVVTPAAVIFTLPFDAGILTLLFPFANIPPMLPVILPTNVVAINAPFAKLALINVLLARA